MSTEGEVGDDGCESAGRRGRKSSKASSSPSDPLPVIPQSRKRIAYSVPPVGVSPRGFGGRRLEREFGGVA